MGYAKYCQLITKLLVSCKQELFQSLSFTLRARSPLSRSVGCSVCIVIFSSCELDRLENFSTTH